MAKLNFKQSLVLHNPSEIILIYWFAAQEIFLIIINVKTITDTFFTQVKKQHLFEIRIIH